MGDKTQKPPPYTRDYRYFKYKPDCSGAPKEKQVAMQPRISQGKNKSNVTKANGGDGEMKSVDNNNTNVVNAEIICHGNCKCHPKA